MTFCKQCNEFDDTDVISGICDKCNGIEDEEEDDEQLEDLFWS